MYIYLYTCMKREGTRHHGTHIIYDNFLIIIVVNFKLWPQLNKHSKKLVGCTTVFPLFSYTLVHPCLPTHAKNVVQQAFAQTRRDDDARAMPYSPHSLTTTDGYA